MGKFAIGCLGVLLLLVVAGGGIAWFKFIKPGMDFAGDVVRIGQEFQELDRRIDDRSRYNPPADGAVSDEQVQRFLAAQDQIRARMEGRFAALQDKYEDLQRELDERDAEAGIAELAGAYRDLGELLLEAKRAQVEALNAQDFSLGEYTWVRNQLYRAIGESVAVAAVGDSGAAAGRGGRVHPDTVARVEPHREALLEAHALAWWGL